MERSKHAVGVRSCERDRESAVSYHVWFHVLEENEADRNSFGTYLWIQENMA